MRSPSANVYGPATRKGNFLEKIEHNFLQEVIVMKRINPKNVWKPKEFVHATMNASIMIISGQVARDADGNIVGDSFEEQARQTLRNVKNIVESQGKSLDDIMKLTIFVKDIRYGTEFYQKIFGEFFSPDKIPASTFVGITSLWNERQLIEIEAIVDMS